jgi:hypothetical protein
MIRKTAEERPGGHMDARMPIIDADAHINEPVVRLDAPDDERAPWRVLAERHPGWQQAGQSGPASSGPTRCACTGSTAMPSGSGRDSHPRFPRSWVPRKWARGHGFRAWNL